MRPHANQVRLVLLLRVFESLGFTATAWVLKFWVFEELFRPTCSLWIRLACPRLPGVKSLGHFGFGVQGLGLGVWVCTSTY